MQINGVIIGNTKYTACRKCNEENQPGRIMLNKNAYCRSCFVEHCHLTGHKVLSMRYYSYNGE